MAMIADLPHDAQGVVWDAFTEGLRERQRGRRRRLAATLLECVDALCDREAAARECLLDWMAHLVQHPSHKPSKAIVLVGHERCGMNIVVTLLSRLVPTLQTHDARRHVFGSYNGVVSSVDLLVVESADQPQIEKLRTLLTRTHLSVGSLRDVPSSHHVLLTVDEWHEPSRHFLPIRCSPHCLRGHAAVLREVLTTPGALDEVRALLRARPLG